MIAAECNNLQDQSNGYNVLFLYEHMKLASNKIREERWIQSFGPFSLG